jgi:putative aldouronate transport system substrate-binding protein
LFVQLDPLVEKYGTNLKDIFSKDPDFERSTRALDGNIYGIALKMGWIPECYAVMGINQNWLDKLNLKMPATTDEFYTVLKAFKEKDPNGNGIADEIPWTFQGWNYGPVEMFGAFGLVDSYNDTWLSVTNGKLQYIPVQDGFQDAISWLHKLYAEGLIDQESFS